ncbi:HAD family hydrolase [Waterburya agarophytonicola K14]|uniref:HAD family hydrolase n=1 Tax=Waterburya agarophytonicola KI4 TaxID=2874699 RepID=A0A964BTH4_9CYAN|nr:HAD family hydrolase [Waterburya agarophytonicola KI4]
MSSSDLTIACQGLKFNKIAAIIFDKDGTLENSLPFWREVAIQRARLIDAQIPGVGEPLLMAFGIQDNAIDTAGLMAVGSRQENEIAAAAYIAETGRSWHEARKIARQAFDEISQSKYLIKNPESAPLFPEVIETLQSFKSEGLKLGILSADSTQGVEEFVTNHKLQDYIQLSMGVDGKLLKPDPQLYIQACQALKVAPEQTLMVGDSWGDIQMAKAAKAAGTIAVIRHQGSVSLPGDVTIFSLSEIQILSDSN